MVFNLWTLGSTVVHFFEFCFLWVTDGTFLSLPVVLATGFFFLVVYVSWKSTETPSDIPSPPRPPFVITIRPPNNDVHLQHISSRDIRVVSTRPYLLRVTRPSSYQILSGREIVQGTQSQSPQAAQPRTFSRFNWFRRGHNQPRRSLRSLLTTSRPHLPLIFNRLLSRSTQTEQVISIPISTAPLASPSGNDTITSDIEGVHTDEEIFDRPGPATSSDRLDSSVIEQSTVDQMEPAPPGQLVKFTIKFLNDTQIEVVTSENEKIGPFKRRHFSQEFREKKIVRLIFNGRVIDDGLTLKEAGIFEDCVVHCLTVSPPPPPTDPSNEVPRPVPGGPNPRRGIEPGFFFVALLGLILISLWIICFNYGQQLFTQSAVVSLSVLTGIFLIGLIAFYFPVHPAGGIRT